MKTTTFLISGLLTLALNPLALAANTTHDAHEHGAATMNVAWLNQTLGVSLQTPAFNLVGFEHAPQTKEQQQFVDSIEHALRDPAKLIALTPATCRLVHLEVASPFAQEHHEGEHHKEEHHKEEHHKEEHHKEEHHKEEHHKDSADVHSEYTVDYEFRCEALNKPLQLNFAQWFKQFPQFEDIDVQWLSDGQQGSVELTKEQSKLVVQ